MLRFVVIVVAAVVAVHLAEAVDKHEDPECMKECDPQACPVPENCLAGMVKDRCGCCFECGRAEGERCDHPSFVGGRGSWKRNGTCGEDLECRIRTDLLTTDPLEALCFCIKTEALCGSDGRTYENQCQLTAARYRRRDSGLRAVSRGPCKAAPRIVSGPANVVNKTGSYVALTCEVTGWPVPTIEWRVDRGRGEPIPLPSDDSHVAVQTRGGPIPYEVTSWLQILSLVPEDQATYWCVASNSEGHVQASATVVVSNAPQRGAVIEDDDSYYGENDL